MKAYYSVVLSTFTELSKPSPQSMLEYFITPKETLYPLQVIPILPNPPSPWQLPVYFLSL